MQFTHIILATALYVSSAAAASFRLKASADAPPVVAGKYLGMGFLNTETTGAILGWNHPEYTDFEGTFVDGEVYLAGAKEKQIMYLRETITEELRPKYQAKVGVPEEDVNPADGTPAHDTFQAQESIFGYDFETDGFLSDWTACGKGKAAGDEIDQVDLYLGESPVFDTGCYASFKLEVEYIET